MRVLIISNCALIESQGSGYVIVNTAKAISDLGHQLDIVPPSKYSFLPSLKGKAYYYRATIGMAKWAFQNRNNIITYDYIITYGGESALMIYYLKKILKIKVPIVMHSNGLEMHVEFRLRSLNSNNLTPKKWYSHDQSFIFKYCYKNADSIITVSKYDADFGINFLDIPASKIFYIEPALPKVFFEMAKKNHQNKKNVITYCGSWIHRKGIETITNALPIILKKYPNYIFRIIGVGKEFKVLDFFPKEIIDQIELYPVVEKKESLFNLYNDTSIFLFPSICESFGLVVAEAMFCNCAVISGPTGIAANIINNKEAIILETPNSTNVIEALENLIINDFLRMTLGENARKRTEVLNWENYTENLKAIIEKIILNFNKQ